LEKFFQHQDQMDAIGFQVEKMEKEDNVVESQRNVLEINVIQRNLFANLLDLELLLNNLHTAKTLNSETMLQENNVVIMLKNVFPRRDVFKRKENVDGKEKLLERKPKQDSHGLKSMITQETRTLALLKAIVLDYIVLLKAENVQHLKLFQLQRRMYVNGLQEKEENKEDVVHTLKNVLTENAKIFIKLVLGLEVY